MNKLYIFDLDFTLWDAGGTWCDCTVPPYYWNNGKLFDRIGHHIRLYSDVPEILQKLSSEGRLLAVASRTEEPDWARQLLKMLRVDHFFNFKEIYPGSKTTHLNRIKEASGINFSEMIFFDDEYRNIEDATRLGVKSVYVRNGIHSGLIDNHW